MTRRWLPVALLIFGLAVRAEDPKPAEGENPVRLKKKNKAAPAEPPKEVKQPDEKTDEKKEDEKKDDKPNPEPGPGAKEDEKKEVLERIARNMKAVEDRLVNKELNESTKQLQDDIIKDLATLIQMAENPPSSPPPQGGAGSPPPSGDESKGSSSRQPKPMNDMNPMSGTKPMNDKGPMPGMNPMPGTGDGTDPMNRVTNSNDPPKPPNDDEKNGRIGLRETKRTSSKAEGSNGESLPKYQELIQAYRKNLARQKD